MAKIDSTFAHDAYNFLIKPLRDADTDGVLERYMGAAQEGFETIQGNILSLDALRDPDIVPDAYVGYQAWLAGWTSELATIKDGLSDDDLRRLLTISIPMWKLKGTPSGIVSMLRLFTGHDALLWDWFRFRPVAGVASLSYQRLDGDAWVIGDSFDYSDDQDTSYIWINARANKQLAHDLIHLNRPAGERIKVCFADVVDDFSTSVDILSPDSASFAPSHRSATHDALLPAGMDAEINIDASQWAHLSLSAAVNLPSSSAVVNLATHVSRVGTTITDGYMARMDGDGAVTLYSIVSGSTSTVATATMDFSPKDIGAERVHFGIVVTPYSLFRHTVTVWADTEVLIEQDLSVALTQQSGGEMRVIAAGADSTMDNLLAYQLKQRPNLPGLVLDTVHVTSTSDQTPVEITHGAPAALAARSHTLSTTAWVSGLSGWTAAGDWQIGTRTSVVGVQCAICGVGVPSYRRGLPSSSPSSATSTLTSPDITVDLGNVDDYQIVVTFYEMIGIDAFGDLNSLEAEVYDGATWHSIFDIDYSTFSSDFNRRKVTLTDAVATLIWANGAMKVRFTATTPTTPINRMFIAVDDVRVSVLAR